MLLIQISLMFTFFPLRDLKLFNTKKFCILSYLGLEKALLLF
jgi:hypothetical protein